LEVSDWREGGGKGKEGVERKRRCRRKVKKRIEVIGNIECDENYQKQQKLLATTEIVERDIEQIEVKSGNSTSEVKFDGSVCIKLTKFLSK
jgi:hypothetical protein